MTIVEPLEQGRSIRLIGRIGTIKGEAPTAENYPNALARNPWAGIYQRKKTKKGKKISRMKFYITPNPRTPAQQAWRAVFGAGKIAWDSLTEPQKTLYNKRGQRIKMSGYNLFQREYLNSHKLG